MSQSISKKASIIFLAPLPPPYMGPSVATSVILGSKFSDKFDVIHIDTADRRPLNTLGRIDFTNIFLAFKHYIALLYNLIFMKSELVYIPISQTTIGYLRDIPLILLSRIFRKKIILHLRGGGFRYFYDGAGLVMKLLVISTLKLADRMIVLGDCLKPMFSGLMDMEKVNVVPNGMDIRINRDYKNRELRDGTTVLFLSNMIAEKGFWDLLDAAEIVLSKHKDIRFVFAGEWEHDQDRVHAEDLVRSKHLENKIYFKGRVIGEEKKELLKDADIFVLPTYYKAEGHPWVIVEAMAAELPIISTDQGAIKESVLDGINGFIIQKQNPYMIAEKINLLIDNPKLLISMSKKSFEIYQRKFTANHFVERMTAVFKDVINS